VNAVAGPEARVLPAPPKAYRWPRPRRLHLACAMSLCPLGNGVPALAISLGHLRSRQEERHNGELTLIDTAGCGQHGMRDEGNGLGHRGSVTWRIASGRREREGMDAGNGCRHRGQGNGLGLHGGDGEGNCAIAASAYPASWSWTQVTPVMFLPRRPRLATRPLTPHVAGFFMPSYWWLPPRRLHLALA
jgi:hypothetical protein